MLLVTVRGRSTVRRRRAEVVARSDVKTQGFGLLLLFTPEALDWPLPPRGDERALVVPPNPLFVSELLLLFFLRESPAICPS